MLDVIQMILSMGFVGFWVCFAIVALLGVNM